MTTDKAAREEEVTLELFKVIKHALGEHAKNLDEDALAGIDAGQCFLDALELALFDFLSHFYSQKDAVLEVGQFSKSLLLMIASDHFADLSADSSFKAKKEGRIQ